MTNITLFLAFCCTNNKKRERNKKKKKERKRRKEGKWEENEVRDKHGAPHPDLGFGGCQWEPMKHYNYASGNSTQHSFTLQKKMTANSNHIHFSEKVAIHYDFSNMATTFENTAAWNSSKVDTLF